MLNRWTGVGLLIAGTAIGFGAAGLRESPVASAQAVQSKTTELKESIEVDAPWLGAAAHLEITATGVSIAGRYKVACEQ
ncbi:MAG TPA: hypothetical protein VFO67_10685 [Gemmatimonadales bacterium]|nr:hypothetical protein [Gemmatimonadales bacterium]